MPLVAVEFILKVILWVAEWLINKKKNNDELLKAFKEFAELARTENIKTIANRKKAESQLEAGSKKWDEIEDLEQKEKADAKKG